MDALTIGPIHTLVEDAVYALPARKVMVHASAAVEVSNDSTTGFVALSSSTTGVETSAAFVRCTTANALVTVKA